MKLILRVFWIAACVGLFAGTASAGTVTLFNNIGANYLTNGGADPIDDSVFGPLSDSFMTPGTPVLLTDVQVSVMVEGTPNPGGSVTITLNADSAGTPGGVLTTIGTLSDTGTPIPVGPPATVFDFSVPSFPLAANTRYWIQLGSTNESAAFWTWSFDTPAGINIPGQLFANQSGVFPDSDGPYMMLVNAFSAIPEPSSAVLLGVGLGGIILFRRRRKPQAA
jgi:hypothetical protein